jgi:hypothetical protein
MSTHFTSISKATSGAHYYEQDSVFFLTHERSEQENFAFTTGVSLLESRVPNIMATTPPCICVFYATISTGTTRH